MISLLETNTPIGSPPPNAFASVSISGTIPNCSKAKKDPVLPIPHWISSKIRSAPVSVHFFGRDVFKVFCKVELDKPYVRQQGTECIFFDFVSRHTERTMRASVIRFFT